MARQGPHHGAQKSTNTGTSELSTSWSNAASVKVRVFSPAICLVLAPLPMMRKSGVRMQAGYRNPARGSQNAASVACLVVPGFEILGLQYPDLNKEAMASQAPNLLKPGDVLGPYRVDSLL